jgi:hypothetical protein
MEFAFSFLVRLFHPLVGSRTGAVPLGFTDLFLPVSSWECPNSASIGPSPIPASSNPACGFPALGFPVCFSSRLCGWFSLGVLSLVAFPVLPGIH